MGYFVQSTATYGGRTRARTWDPLIKSQLLYQLSYAPGSPSAGKPAKRASSSKARPGCPAARTPSGPTVPGKAHDAEKACAPARSEGRNGLRTRSRARQTEKAAGRTRRLLRRGLKRQEERLRPPPATREPRLTAAAGRARGHPGRDASSRPSCRDDRAGRALGRIHGHPSAPA